MGEAIGLDPSVFPGQFISTWLMRQLLSRNRGLQAVSAALSEEHTSPCPQHASFQMFFKKKIRK